MSDLDATVAFAKESGKGDTSRLGITGFCWGGRIIWLYAAHNPEVKAGVAWYGRLVGGEREHAAPPGRRRGRSQGAGARPLRRQGQGIPLDTVEKMRAACKAAGKTCEIVVYPDAAHAFHADYRPSYRGDSRERRLGASPRLVQIARRRLSAALSVSAGLG